MNSSGTFVWGDICEYKNAVTFTAVGANTWVVPAGVTKVRVEVWGGGGGASGNGSGGGGGYVTGVFTVSGGNVSYTVGAAGNAGLPAATNGGQSSASYGAFFVNAVGGEGDNSAAIFAVAAGGSFNGSSAAGFYGAAGEAGAQNRFEGYQLNSTTYRENQAGGKGGDGGNTVNTGGKGGGSSGIWGGSIKNGGQGIVIIHY